MTYNNPLDSLISYDHFIDNSKKFINKINECKSLVDEIKNEIDKQISKLYYEGSGCALELNKLVGQNSFCMFGGYNNFLNQIKKLANNINDEDEVNEQFLIQLTSFIFGEYTIYIELSQIRFYENNVALQYVYDPLGINPIDIEIQFDDFRVRKYIEEYDYVIYYSVNRINYKCDFSEFELKNNIQAILESVKENLPIPSNIHEDQYIYYKPIDLKKIIEERYGYVDYSSYTYG